MLFSTYLGVSAGHLTGSYKVRELGFWNNTLVDTQEPYTLHEMFFKPYDTNEFLNCLIHLIQPVLYMGLTLLNPWNLIIYPVALAACASFFQVISLFLDPKEAKAMQGQQVTSYLQALSDIALAPLAVLTMLTRGISTAVDAINPEQKPYSPL